MDSGPAPSARPGMTAERLTQPDRDVLPTGGRAPSYREFDPTPDGTKAEARGVFCAPMRPCIGMHEHRGHPGTDHRCDQTAECTQCRRKRRYRGAHKATKAESHCWL